MVTAEAALVLPLIAAFALAMIYLVSIALAKVTTVDAARDAARALARGDSPDEVMAQAEATAPRGAQIEIVRDGDQISVTVLTESESPGWMFVPMPSVAIKSQATVESEVDGVG